ncbi:MAG TPA: NADP-dependent oxidoreductase [Polyangiaceae bacterium]
MRTLRFHRFGEPADVLVLENAPVPAPPANRIRIAVHACGLNPADWALCRGLAPGKLPRGVGLDVSGFVDAVGEGVTDVAVGDRIVGNADFMGETSAGAADFAILDHWAKLPDGVDFVHAASLPMALETAALHLDAMGLKKGETIVVNGAGTMIGFAAVQIALLRGLRVIATAGPTFTDRLRALGVEVTTYGEGMGDRLRALANGSIDHVFDTAFVLVDPKVVNEIVTSRTPQTEAKADSPLPELIRAAGDPKKVVTITDVSAQALGARSSFDLMKPTDAGPEQRAAILRRYLPHVADGSITIPLARTFPLHDWREAVAISLSGNARGKLVLQVR